MKKYAHLIFIFIAALVIALVHIHRSQAKAFFYQTYFEPAVMIACGKGFAAASEGPATKLADFLNEKTQTFDCADLPIEQKLTDLFPARPWYHMMYTVGWIWKVTGIDWAVINYLVSFLFALSICFAYGLFRLITGPWVSMGAALFWAMSPMHREYLSQFRDYSKTPFFLAGLLLLGLTVRSSLSTARKVIVAVGLGVVVGVGYGFRTDLLVMVPFSVLIFLFLQPEGLKKNLLVRGGMVAAFLMTFLIVALPIFRRNVDMGACTWHFPLSGFADQFTDKLGLDPSLYSWMFEANDRTTAFMVFSFADRVHSIAHDKIRMCSAVYDQVSKEIVIEFIKTFPADFYRRFLASIPTVLTARDLEGTNLYLVFLGFICLWFVGRRLALFYFLIVTYFCGHAFFQLQQRHYFYLEFILWWALACLISIGLSQIKIRGGRNWRAFFQSPRFKSLLVVLALIVGSVFVVRSIADYWQGQSLMGMSARLESLSKEKLDPGQEVKGSDLIVDLMAFPYEIKPDALSTELAVIHFNSEKCKDRKFDFRINYNSDDPYFDLSRNIPIQLLDGEKSRNFYLQLNFHDNQIRKILSRPISLTFSAPSKECFDGISRVLDRSTIRLWMDFSVPDNVQPKDLKHKFRHRYFE